MQPVNLRQLCNMALAATLAVILSACAGSSVVERQPVRVQVQEAVGFTITEEANISEDVRADYNQALTQLDRGNVQQGIALLQAVVEVAPQLSAPRIDLGIAYHESGNLEAAEQHLRRALEDNPGHPIALNELGIVLRKTGRFAEAKRSYESALSVYPGYHYARRNLAVLCDLYLADYACALRNYEAYMATVPHDDEASMWIRDLQYRMQQPEGE